MDFFSGVWNWFKGTSITSSLAKVALLGYASKLLNKTTEPVSTGSNEIVDKGVRLQLNPNTENKIPVLYGEAYFGGYVTDAQLSTDYKKMTYCLTLAELTGDKVSTLGATSYSFTNVYINNNRVIFKADGYTVDYTVDSSGNQDISARGLIKIYLYCDQTGIQPVGYSGSTPSPFTAMPGWSSLTHSMEDLMYAIVEVTYNRDAGISALPDITVHANSTMTLVGDVLYDYMTNTVYGAGIDPTEIDVSSLITLNTFCSSGFNYTNTLGSTVSSQITVNGLVDTNTDVLTNMQALAEAGCSWLTYDIHTGLWKIVINKAGGTIASFSDDNIIGEISISGTSLTQLNNIADVKYQNTDIQDKTDFVKITIPSGDLFDNEPLNSIQINLPFTNKQVVAAKIGLQQLKQGRVDKIISFKSDYSYILLGAGDLIDITSSVYGFTAKVFRIVTVTQTEGDAGEILLDFTALEYDDTVYDYDITEYEVESDNGILGIGSIGKPNTPTVTKTEEANVPKIVINGVVPSGVVDTLEYWITFDTGVSESNRNYIKIGQYTDPAGATLTEDATHSYTYTGLQQSDFYIKIRGTNSVTVGPYSDPSGLIEYVPVVVADTISDTPVSVGGQLMGLGLLTLLNNLDKLFGGDSGSGSMFEKIFSIFNEKTGVDLVGSAEAGSLVVASDIMVKDEGNTLTTKTSSINFVGDGVTVTGSGNAVTVTINGTTSGGGGSGGSGGDTPTTCFMTPAYYYPPDKTTNTESYPEDAYVGGYSADHAPITGYYAIQFSSVYSALTKNAGSIYLYKSNGTLVQTLSASDLVLDKNIVKIPFSTRVRGTDYYILMDGGVVKNAAGCLNPAISDPKTWNFNTPWDDPTAYDLVGQYTAAPPGCAGLSFVGFGVRSKLSDTVNKASRQTDIRINWGYDVVSGYSGSVKIYTAGGSLVQTINASDTFASQKVSELLWVSGTYLYIDPTVDLDVGVTYYVTIDSGVVRDACGNPNPAVTNSSSIRFTVDPGPTATVASLPSGGSINESPVAMTFDRPVIAGSGNLVVYDASNNVVATVAPTDPAVTITQGVA